MKLSLDIFEKLKEERASFYIYFSTPNCGVCHVLAPKLKAFMEEKFPKIEAFEVNNAVQPEIAAQLSLFTNPSLLVYLDGKEFLRKSRVIGLGELEEELNRPYQLFFE